MARPLSGEAVEVDIRSGSSASVAGPLGRRSDATSLSVAVSTEDAALYGALTETAPATDTASSGMNGRLQRIAQRLTSLIALLPVALGGTTAANSLPVVLSSDGPFATQTGSVTETAPATDTASSGLNGRLQRIAQRITSLIALLPAALGQGTMAQSLRVVLASDQASIPVAATGVATEVHLGEVGGNLVMISTEFTRPADTTAYAANDVVSDSTSATTMEALAGAARVSGGSGYIVGIRIATDKKSIVPRIRLHLFNTNGATLAADNAAWKDLYADSAKRVGYWDLPAMITGADSTNSDNSRSIDLACRIPFTCAVTSLYYVTETLDAFTPASGQKFTVTLFVDRN